MAEEYPEFNLDIFKMGYFILYANEGGFIGNSIEKAQIDYGFSREDAMYVHIDVSGGGPFAVRVNPPKTKVVDIRDTYPGREIALVKYNADNYDLFSKKRYKVAFWSATHCNLAYDWLGVIRFRISLIWHWLRSYFCSENAMWALQKEYPYDFDIKPEDTMPAYFLDEDKFTVVWMGRIPKK